MQKESQSPDILNTAIHSPLYFYKRTDLSFVTVLVNQFQGGNLNPNSSQVTQERSECRQREKCFYFICTKYQKYSVP